MLISPQFSLWPNSTNKINTENVNDASALSKSEDPPTNNNATLSPDNEVLLSKVFPYHSLMVKHFKNMPSQKNFCLQSTLNNPSPQQSYLISFLMTAVNPWDRIQLNPWYKKEGVICVALPNLMAVPGVITVVLMFHIFGMLILKKMCFALEDQTFPTIISHCPNQQ